MTAPRFRPALAGFGSGLLLAAVLLGGSAITRRVPARLDLADFFWPMKAYTAQRWAAGTPPLWNPLSGCGEPWLAQLQTGVFYPGDAPFFLGGLAGPLVAIALHLAIAAAGMCAWLWDLGASRTASLVSAVVYAGGGAFLSLVPVYNNACTAAWVPWLFLGARRLVRGEPLVTFTASSALAFLAGEPALALAGMGAAAVVALATRHEGEAGVPQRLEPAVLRLVGAVALAAGLVAVTALPFAELVARTGRLSSVTSDEAVSRSIGASELADLVAPESAEAQLRFRPERGGYLLSLALGPAPLLLACGCAAGFPGRRRLLALLFAIGALAALVALGAPGRLAPALYDLGLLRMRFPARWFLFMHLGIAAAAGAGLDGFLYGRFRKVPTSSEGDSETESPFPTWPALATVVTGVLLIVALSALALRDADARGGVRLLVVGASTAIALGAIVVARLRGGSARLAAILAACAVAPLPFIARDPLEGAPSAALNAPPRALPERVPPGRVFVALHDPSLLAGWMASFGGAWSAAIPERAHQALAGYANLAHGIATPTSPSPINDPRNARLLGSALLGGNAGAVLGLADVGTLLTPFPASIPGARLTRRGDGVFAYELSSRVGRVFFARSVEVADDAHAAVELRRRDLDPEARAFVADPDVALPRAGVHRAFAVARVEKDLPEELSVSTNTSGPAFLVVTRTHDPGWRALLDGAPARLARVDLAFMGLAVPAGEHRVVLRYRPLSFRVGAAISGVSLLVFVAFWLAGGPKR